MDVLPNSTELPAPEVPLALDDEQGNGGLSYDDLASTPDRLILVKVGPWGDFQDGDTLKILWGINKEVVASREASKADANKILNVFVPARAIHNIGNGTHPVTVRVINVLGIPIESPATLVRVKLSVPGGHDPDAHTPYANENLAVPVIHPGEIKPDTPSAIVTIFANALGLPYENISEGDMVTVRWNVEGNDILYGPLTAAEAASTVPLAIAIDREALDAGGVGDAVKVTYQIYDVVRNWSLWSPYAQVVVVDPNAPQMPWVEGTVDEAGEVLDMDVLGSVDLTVLVEGSGATTGDEVTVYWAGATAAGQPVTYDTPAQTLTRPGQTLKFTVPSDKVRPLIQGSGRAWYTIVPKIPGALRTSARRNLALIGQLTLYRPPSVAEAKADTLDPGDLGGGPAHATVPPWDGMQVSDRIDLIGEGKTVTGENTFWHELRDVSGSMVGRDMAFDIPGDTFPALIDGSLHLYYEVTPFGTGRRGRTWQRSALAVLRSEPLDLLIRDANAQPLLAPLTIPELVDGVLDPETSTTAHARVPAYSGIATRDRVDIAIRGGIAAYDDYLNVSSPAAPPVFILSSDFIDSNRDQSLTATYTVTRIGGGVAKSQPLPFRIGSGEAEIPLSIGQEQMGVRVGYSEQRLASGGSPPYRYLSKAPAIATVNESTGTVTGVVPGFTEITVSDQATPPAHVEYPVGVIAVVSIDDATMLLEVGKSQQRTAENGVPPYSYFSDNTDVATVNESTGWVTAKAPGNTLITAFDWYKDQAQYPVSVGSAFFINPEPMTLDIGSSKLRQASGGTTPYTYVSLDTGVATVDADGLTTGRGAGSTQITVKDIANHSGGYDVTVGEDFSIGQGTMVLDIGDTERREARGGTPPYHYDSRPTTVAIVDPFSGLVTAKAAGSAIIDAYDNAGHSDSYDVIVTPPAVIELLSPEPDYLEPGGRISMDRVDSHPIGFYITVKQYRGMASGQKIKVTVITPVPELGDFETKTVEVTAIQDYAFVVDKSFIQNLFRLADPANAGILYTVETSAGVSLESPLVRVIFYRP